MESIVDVLKDAPASFIPTLIGQMSFYQDANIKNPKDRNAIQETMKRAAKKVPFLNKYVPNRIGTTGKPVEIKNPTLFNLFINPSITTVFEPSPGTELVVDIFERGLGTQKRQFPRRAPSSITVGGKPLILTTEEQGRLQELMGTETIKRLDTLAAQAWPWRSSPEAVAKIIDTKILNISHTIAKQTMIKELGGIRAIKDRQDKQEKK